MTHVSKRKIEQKQLDKIYTELIEHLTRRGVSRERAKFCKELFTPTEQIMLAKRLALVCMIGEGFSFSEIERVLKVTPRTIERMWLKLKTGRCSHTVAFVRKNKIEQPILKILGTLITGPLRSHSAPRWEWLDQL